MPDTCTDHQTDTQSDTQSDIVAKLDVFFRDAERWRDEMLAMRTILLDTPLVEEFKWKSPCYTFQQGNIAVIWGLKDHCGIGFFKGALLKDDAGVLVAPGENSRSARKMVFTETSLIRAMEPVIRAYVSEAIELEKAGRKVEFKKDDLPYPDELIDALDRDPDLRAAFETLTPGRRRGYVLHFSQPKQSRTRTSRIDKTRLRILAGKGMHDR